MGHCDALPYESLVYETMPEHLSAEEITSYRQRRTPPEELLRVDDHISQCAECRERLFSPSELGALDRYLKRSDVVSQVAPRSEHLSYEQLEAFVDGKMSSPTRKGVEAHLRACQLCADEARDLNTFKVELKASAVGTKGWGPFFRRWLTLQRIAFAIATAAVIVLAIDVARWRSGPSKESPSVLTAKSSLPNKETLEVINQLPVNDQSAIREAVFQERIKSPDVLGGLRAKQQTLLGELQENTQFEVLSPVGEVVPDELPVFQWKPTAKARSYSVTISDTHLKQVESSGPLKAMKWTPKHPLKRGETYVWQVTALLDGGKVVSAPSPPSPEAKFKVLDQGKMDEITRFQEAHPESHIALGILCAQAGLLEKAEHELELVPQNDPEHELAGKLLKRIQELRQPAH